MADNLGDMLKALEAFYTEPRARRDAFTYVRLDGRAFHTLTKGYSRPFDTIFSTAMIEATEALIKEFQPDITFVQSDEISLGWYPRHGLSELPFNGKFHKLLSVVPSFCSSHFTRSLNATMIKPPTVSFDARVVSMGKLEFLKMFYWRFIDARKNAVSMVAQVNFSDKELHGVVHETRKVMCEDVYGKPLDEVFEPRYMYGTFIIPTEVTRPLNAEEKAAIPLKYQPDLITRRDNHKTSRDFNGFSEFYEHFNKDIME